MRKKKILFIALFSTIICSCVSVEKGLNSKIKNYNYKSSLEFLQDSCISDFGLAFFNSGLNSVERSPLKTIDELKEMIRVIPVLNVDIKALDYDYSQDFLKYIREVKPNEHNRFVGFIYLDSRIVWEVYARKLKGESWHGDGLVGFRQEGDPFLENLIKEYPNRFFFCTALDAFCVVKEGELYVCRRNLKKLQTVKEYFNSYFPLKDFKERLHYYSGKG